MTTPYPVKYIQRKKYYRVPQSQAITPDGGINLYNEVRDACTGCSLRKLREEDPCPEYKDKKLYSNPVICQDYEYDIDSVEPNELGRDVYHDYHVLKDYIFIPATKKGIADYVAHLLEVS
jgi:hypothetical protein